MGLTETEVVQSSDDDDDYQPTIMPREKDGYLTPDCLSDNEDDGNFIAIGDRGHIIEPVNKKQAIVCWRRRCMKCGYVNSEDAAFCRVCFRVDVGRK